MRGRYPGFCKNGNSLPWSMYNNRGYKVGVKMIGIYDGYPIFIDF